MYYIGAITNWCGHLRLAKMSTTLEKFAFFFFCQELILSEDSEDMNTSYPRERVSQLGTHKNASYMRTDNKYSSYQ